MVLLVINKALGKNCICVFYKKTSWIGQTIFLVYQQSLFLILLENCGDFDYKNKNAQF